MRRSSLVVAATLVVAAIIAACSDKTLPTGPLPGGQINAQLSQGTCTTLANLQILLRTLFANRTPDVNSALGKLDNLDKQLHQGHTPQAQAAALDLIKFLQQKATGPGKPLIQLLIKLLECYVGLNNDTVLVLPTDQQQTVINGAGTAGVLLPPNPVTEPTLITVTILDPNSPPPLNTKLDQYPGYVSITQQSGVTNSLTGPVVVAVCPAAGIPDAIRNRLRLGHQASAGFEITPAADASFLNCATGTASNDRGVKKLLHTLANLVLPKPLYARMRATGGIGGSATEFSPFDPVDPVLRATGGVGGTATEFKRTPATPPTGIAGPVAPKTPSANKLASGATVSPKVSADVLPVDCTQAQVGAALVAQCRPQVTITTELGTILQNVPVGWAIGSGGGTTAIDDPTTRTCGTFGAAAAGTTNVNGKAGACWTMGAVAGTNTLVATPSAGGDAPSGVSFSTASFTFTVNALKNTAPLSLGGLTATYDGTPKSATATTTPAGLNTVTITYNGSPTAPTGAGSYTVVATLDNPSYTGSATGTLVIGLGAQSALSVTGPASAAFGSAPVQLGSSGGSGGGAVTFDATGSTACAVTSGGMLSITGGTGTCSIIATKAADANYSSISSAPFAVTLSQGAQSALSVTGTNTIVFGGSTVALGTTGGNGGGAVSFDAGTSTACSATSAGVVTATAGTGTCAIAATKAGDANYLPVTSLPFALTISKGAATLSIGNLNQTYNGTQRSVSVTSTPAALSVISVTYNGSATAPTAAGSYAVVASLSNPNYSASDASATLVIAEAAQAALSVTGSASATFGAPAAQLGTSGGSGNGAVTFSAAGSTACSVTAGGLLSVTTGTGTCSVTATKADDGNFSAISSPEFPIAIGKATATLALSNLSWTYDGSAKSATAAATPAVAGIAITYNGSPSAPVNAGSYAVVAALTNPDYAAVNATGTLVIGQANQSPLAVIGASSATFGGGTVPLGTTGGSGTGVVSFDASTTPAACSVNTSTGVVTVLLGTGSCVVTATKAGDLNYFPVTSGLKTITLAKASQFINFAGLGGKTYGDAAFAVSASATSGLPVTFSAGAGDKCTIAGATVTLTGAGSCTVTASQPGNANFYNAAAPVPQTFAIAKHAATATAGSGTMLFGATIPPLPCTVTGLLPADAGTVSCSTVVPAITQFGNYATTPSVSPSSPANYAVSGVNGTLTVSAFTQRSCFAAPIIGGNTPPVTSGLRKGTSVTVSCRLVDGTGRPIVTAHGNLLVQDLGTNGLGTPPGTPAFSGTNVFTVTNDGDFDSNDGYYKYSLSTSPTAFIKGHYYRVTATWSDGSATTGWIYISP